VVNRASRGGNRLVQPRELRRDRREFRTNWVGQLELSELRHGVLGLSARKTQALATHRRFDHRDIACSRSHQCLTHHEFGADVALGLRDPVNCAVRPKP
jgi:hypothetical protein